jgi:hypothetical protein
MKTLSHHVAPCRAMSRDVAQEEQDCFYVIVSRDTKFVFCVPKSP